MVLSHGHWDHTDGLPALAEMGIRPPVLAHPDVFADRHKATGEYNGAGVGRQWVADTFGLTESRDPVELAPDVWFLGEVPRNNDFEARTTTFFQLKDGERTPDFLMDDTALALRTTKGLVVVTGCSHAGICNICEHAREVCGDARLHMVMGGFHLLDDSPVLERTIEYFRSHNVERLLPMHCTALPGPGADVDVPGRGQALRRRRGEDLTGALKACLVKTVNILPSQAEKRAPSVLLEKNTICGKSHTNSFCSAG